MTSIATKLRVAPLAANKLLAVVFALCSVSALVARNASEASPMELAASSEHIVRQPPIVIHTQQRDYDQPTLDDYRVCHEHRHQCLRVCSRANNKESCEAECPLCPVLFNGQLYVQGVNDSEARVPAARTPSNTTNIIRLTNEIHNLVDNKMAAIRTRHETNIHVHQNLSAAGGGGGDGGDGGAGGKYGLGSNNGQPCCIVIRASRGCTGGHYEAARRHPCHHRRERMCGEKCKARVMYAKRVVVCDDDDKDDGDHDGDDGHSGAEDRKCRETVKYVPHRPHRCHYSPMWPFVLCPGRSELRMLHCRRCYQLPYGYVLHAGLPPQCLACFESPFYRPHYPPLTEPWPYEAPPFYYPHHLLPPSFEEGLQEWDHERWPAGDDWTGWKLDKIKCRRPDGTIADDCRESTEKPTEAPHPTPTPTETPTQTSTSAPTPTPTSPSPSPSAPTPTPTSGPTPTPTPTQLPTPTSTPTTTPTAGGSSDDPLARLPELEDEIADDPYLTGVDAVRRRRRTFEPSHYSRRHRRRRH